MCREIDQYGGTKVNFLVDILHEKAYTVSKECIDFNAAQKGALLWNLLKSQHEGK